MPRCSRNFHVSDVHLKDRPPCSDAAAGVFAAAAKRTRVLPLVRIPTRDVFLSGKRRILDGPAHSGQDLMTRQVIPHSGQTNQALAPRNSINTDVQLRERFGAN